MKPKATWILIPLLLCIALSGLAATNAQIAKPGAPTTVNTGNPGELSITWEAAAGAQFYTVGWINENDYARVSSAGGDWFSQFHFATVTSANTSYVASGLKGGEAYATIVGAQGARFGGEAPSWSGWSAYVTTAGVSPATADLTVGDVAQFVNNDKEPVTVRITRVDTPYTIQFRNSDGERYDRAAPNGRQWVVVNFVLSNRTSGNVNFHDASDHVMTTDAGPAFSWTADNIRFDPGETRYSALYYDAPVGATTAVLAVIPIRTASTGTNEPALFSFDISQ